VALKTPISQILLALDGKVDFLKKTNPWGGGEEEKVPQKGQAPDFAAKMHMFLTQKMAVQENKHGGT
jgi:hypothetical protein